MKDVRDVLKADLYRCLGRNIRQAIKTTPGLTIKAMAAKAGVSISQFRRYLDGESAPLHVAVVVSETTGWSLQSLIQEETDGIGGAHACGGVDVEILARALAAADKVDDREGDPRGRAVAVMAAYTALTA